MFDNSKLVGRIIEKFKTRTEFAKAMGLTPSTLSYRLKTGNWHAKDIIKATEVLDIPATEISKYFFEKKVR